jgi:hypothetical protein
MNYSSGNSFSISNGHSMSIADSTEREALLWRILLSPLPQRYA